MKQFVEWIDIVDWAVENLPFDVEVAVPVSWPRDATDRWLLVWRTRSLSPQGYLMCGGDAKLGVAA